MRNLKKRRSKKAGMAPGSLVYIGEKANAAIKVKIFDFSEEAYREHECKNFDECLTLRETPSVTWIDIDGVHEVEVMKRLGDIYNLHPLVLEDILNTDQRPKMEDYGDYIYAVLNMLTLRSGSLEIETEQVSIIFGDNFVISFQEGEGDVFDPVRERIRSSKGRVRKEGADYLAYSLMDGVVDNYFIILETLGERLEFLEEDLVKDPTPVKLNEIRTLKREMIQLRKSVWPLRELVGALERGESALIKPTTRAYFKDVYDHTIQVIDTVEVFRDILSGMLDIYLSSISYRMNEVMKVLTIIATIFIPLTFIAGVYGMNFKFMPETQWHYGYFAIMGLMAGLGIFMLIYFRRRKWI